jgi:putative intracellular protease/amidase
MTQIAVLLYQGMTALDAVGPYEVLSRLPGARVRFLGPAAGPVAADTRMLTLHAEAAYEDVPAPDVVVVPGGIGTRALLEDERVLAWIRGADAAATWTTSVCTGALLLAAAGLLDGVEATTHWGALELLGSLGAVPVERRVVEVPGRPVITAAGVSSGIDLALVLAARIAGDDVAQAIQLGIEYDPQPPFDAGSLAKAPPAARALAVQAAAAER